MLLINTTTISFGSRTRFKVPKKIKSFVSFFFFSHFDLMLLKMGYDLSLVHDRTVCHNLLLATFFLVIAVSK